MAVTIKRRRPDVSYREPSSDEDLSEISGEEEQQTLRNNAVPTRRSIRRQPTKDDEQSTSASPKPPPQKLGRSAPRNSRGRGGRRVSYKEPSSDEDDEADDPDADFDADEERPIIPRKRSRATSRSSPQPRKVSGNKSRSWRTMNLGAVLKPNDEVGPERKVADIPTDGHQPAWASLPYHVLLQIFVYASHPLHDENLKPTTSIAWLVRLATMCSAFTKPALTALYRNPPIFATRQTRRDLVHHLITPPTRSHEDYRVMVKRLKLDATQMSSLTDATNSSTDLVALVKSLTTLREIDIFDPLDRPPFRPRLRRTRRWIYPIGLFDALRQTQLHLTSWRWNSSFFSQDFLWMKDIHGDSAFQSLREITFTKFHPDPTSADEEDSDAPGHVTGEELFASALAVLPRLRTLAFETCGIVSGKLLPLLPNNLVSLSITNCGELLSDALQAFLATHGTHLEELVLNHNQALDLSFLVDLKDSCPRLEVLRMDMTYYSSLVMSSDNEPLYETLLGELETPTWPATLRILDMEYLRNWNATSATNFFKSLIDSADTLPWLQSIIIIAMVDTDWRQRAEFRQKWTAKFKKVFARSWEAPNPHLASLRAFREWKQKLVEEDKNDSLIEGVPKFVHDGIDETKVTNDSDSDVPLLPIRAKPRTRDDSWGSKRLRLRTKTTANLDEATDGDTGSPSAEESTEDETLFVQGRCHTVMFRIDNFRPREEIYDEADFLDAEPSGDEEWNGNEDNEEESGYAW